MRHGRRRLALAVACGLVLAARPAVSRPLAAQPSPTAVLERIRTTGNRPIDFHVAAFPDSVFVGQQVTYQVAVLLSEEARRRLRRNPEFLPPELRGLLAYEIGTPTRVAPRRYGAGQPYEAHVFQRALFGVTTGTVRVPSPQLTYSLPQSASFFSREESFMVRAESALVAIRPLPLTGRPADFTGAVGVLRATSRLDTDSARVGDPLVLTVRIAGTANIRLLPRPLVEVSWAAVVPGSERVEVDSSGALVRGWKEFDFLLTPTRDGPVTLPVVRYPYFDPYRVEYLVAETQPADVRIAAGALAAVTTSDESGESLPLRPWRYRPARQPARLTSPATGLAALLLLMLPVPALAALLRRARRRRCAAGVAGGPLTMAQAAPDDPSPAGTARRVRRVLLAELAARLQVAPADVVTRAHLERVLRRRGVTRPTTREVLGVLDELAVRGFAGSAPGADRALGEGLPDRRDLEVRARDVLERVGDEAVSHGRPLVWRRGAPRSGALMVLMVGGAVVSLAPEGLPAQRGTAPVVPSAPPACRSAGSTASSTVTPASATPLDLLVGEGEAAYHAHRYAVAAQRLGEAVAACPQDTDLLVNWGTAAWAAGDTVSAVIAWQRAARLDPVAADVQERLALLPLGAREGLADIPMVPTSTLAVGALVAWALAWGLLWASWRTPQGKRPFEVAAVALLMSGLAAGGAAWWGHRALDASALAVVRRPESLRAAPDFEAATAGGVATGDIVAVHDLQEGWARVRLADARDGWVPASRLAPLLDATGRR